MRVALSIATVIVGAVLASYDPSQLIGVSDPILIAKIEGYMPPICSDLYGDSKHWTDWSNCSAKCGTGQQVRYLTNQGVKNLQSNGCEISIDTQPCTGTTCPQDCIYGDWINNDGKNGGWGACNPATGTQTRARTIKSPAINGGKDCVALWGAATQLQNCPVDCQGTLSDWDKTCDGRTATLSRRFAVAVRDLNGGKACPPSVETKDCDPDCASIPWGDYSPCDPNTGNQTRTRDIAVDGKWLKLQTILKKNNCPTIDVQPCDVNCVVGDWAATAVCDVKTGTKTFKRDVVTPARNCGIKCDSVQDATQLTRTEPCAVSCETSAWGPFVCDPTTGIATSTRQITQPPLN
ncbi:hypothetical protein As57867_005175, partial [Aphanomyces stellatus]